LKRTVKTLSQITEITSKKIKSSKVQKKKTKTGRL